MERACITERCGYCLCMALGLERFYVGSSPFAPHSGPLLARSTLSPTQNHHRHLRNSIRLYRPHHHLRPLPNSYRASCHPSFPVTSCARSLSLNCCKHPVRGALVMANTCGMSSLTHPRTLLSGGISYKSAEKCLLRGTNWTFSTKPVCALQHSRKQAVAQYCHYIRNI